MEEIEKIQEEKRSLKENNNQIQKHIRTKLEQKEKEVEELRRQLYESQSLANKYMNILRKSYFSRLFSGLRKGELERDTKMLF